MKKLLALVLCVMLFVSIIPTSAFAAWPGKVVGSKNTSGGYYAVQDNRDAIDALNDAIDNMYYSLATNQTVFGTAQMLHSLADGMVKDLLADVEDYKSDVTGKTYDHDTLVNNSRAFLKGIIGKYVHDYVDGKSDYFMDDGSIDYEKYLKVYTKGVQNALTSAAAKKGIEAFVTAVYALKVQDAINDAHDDLKDAIVDWNDFGKKWDEFGWQPLGNVFDSIKGPTGDYTFVKPDGFTTDEGITLDGILTGTVS